MKWYIIQEFSTLDSMLPPWAYSYWVHLFQVTDFVAINKTFKKLQLGIENKQSTSILLLQPWKRVINQ
jgi:hypothetical protein